MKVLLTGGGFVGNVLKAELEKRGCEVVVMGRKKDIRNPENFKFFGMSTPDELGRLERAIDKMDMSTKLYISNNWIPDLIVHNASIVSSKQGLENPKETYDVNIMGTVNVMEYAREFGLPVIFLSSCKVEPTSRDSYGSYGVSKVAGELIVKDYWKIYGVPSIIVRPATIFGISQDGTSALGWVTWFIKAMIHDYPLQIEGDGTQERDVIYVNDLVNLLVKMVFNFYEGANQVYEVGWGEGYTVNDAIKKIERLAKRKFTKKEYVGDRLGDPKKIVMDDCDTTMNTWDWAPKVKFADGIGKIYRYYLDHKEEFTKK